MSELEKAPTVGAFTEVLARTRVPTAFFDAEPAPFDITQVSLRLNGACKNHPGWYVHRCQKCRRDARTLHDRAAQKHIDVATQAIAEAKQALCRKRDVVLAEHKLRLAVLAQQQWGEPEEET